MDKHPFNIQQKAFNNNKKPLLIIVSGRPGSGKTTLARKISNTLSYPLISRDEINKGIFHTFNHDHELANKEFVAKATFDTFFRVIELLLSSCVTLVAEAAFQDYRWRVVLEKIVSMVDIKIISCIVEPEIAYQRVISRNLKQQGAHRSTKKNGIAFSSAIRPFEYLSLPVPSLDVVTTNGYDPQFEEIMKFIRSR
jgi:predicted kinase